MVKSEHSPNLTYLFFSFRFWLSQITVHERDAGIHDSIPAQTPYYSGSRSNANRARFKAARRWLEFCREVDRADGFVFVGEHGVLYIGS